MLQFATGVFLIIGSVIGGGVIAIPIASANFGFYITLGLIIASWVVMTSTGLAILRLSLECEQHYNTYYSIVGRYLGDRVKVITAFCFLGLLYLSLSSYTSGCVSLLMSYVPSIKENYSYSMLCLLFVGILGTVITLSKKWVVRTNIVFVSLKLSLLLLVIFASIPRLQLPEVSTAAVWQGGGFLSLLMITINAFGFHFIVPTLVNYYGQDRIHFFKRILVISTSVVCVLYLFWLFAIYSIIPLEGTHGLVSVYQQPNQLLAFNESLHYFLGSHNSVANLMAYFQMISIFGSFFCVSLGVMDFVIDMVKSNNKFIVGALTFLPPFLLTMSSQNMYLIAMSAAGYIAIFLEIIIPYWALAKS